MERLPNIDLHNREHMMEIDQHLKVQYKFFEVFYQKYIWIMHIKCFL